jgi:hypothetical protein
MRYIVYKQDRYNDWIIILGTLSCGSENLNEKRAMNILWAGLPPHRDQVLPNPSQSMLDQWAQFFQCLLLYRVYMLLASSEYNLVR